MFGISVGVIYDNLQLQVTVEVLHFIFILTVISSVNPYIHSIHSSITALTCVLAM